MRKLSLIIILLAIVIFSVSMNRSDSPHGSNFNLSCSLCHSSDSWKLDMKIYSFDHNTTAMPLTGQHQNVNCRSCHPTLVFSEAETECAGCHTDIHANSVGFDCGRCHTPKSWVIENITDIHRKSRFPLFGKHYTADCSECHRSASQLQFEPIGVNCIDCHEQDYLATTHPNHTEANFSKECIQCHSLSGISWNTTNIDHSFFPLKLGHEISDCSRCHTGGNFTGLSPECVTCHLDNYNASVNPSHTAANIPQNCNECHTLEPGWKPASFAIHNNYWPIMGAHTAVSCNTCHNGSYSNTPNTCVGCHLNDYNNTTDPNHASAQFGTDCEACHSQNGWKPATFDHDQAFFPIYSGKHQGTWNLCTDCHTNPANYQVFTCIDCHDHNQADMDAKHSGVGGYIYTSPACFACHPQGIAEGAFNHNTSIFPLTGAHIQVNCNNCHTNGFPNTPV
jgi:hypothetical protein